MSSSPPKIPSPDSSESQDFKIEESSSDDDDQEVSSNPLLNPNLVHTPQPISSYDPNFPYLCSINTQFDDSPTTDYIKSLGLDMNAIMNLGDPFMPPDNMSHDQWYQLQKSRYDQLTAGISRTDSPAAPEKKPTRKKLNMKQRARRWCSTQFEKDIAGPSDGIELVNSEKQTQVKAQNPVLIKEPGEPKRVYNEEEEGDENAAGDEFLFIASKNEAEDDYYTLSLLVYCRATWALFPPCDFPRGRCRRRERELRTKSDLFKLAYGNARLNQFIFPSELAYTLYKMSNFLWGVDVPRTDGSGSSSGIEAFLDPNDDYNAAFNPKAPFYDPDSNSFPFDDDDVYDKNLDTDPYGSYLDSDVELLPDDPFFDDPDDYDDPILDRVVSCFGANQEDVTAKPVTRVSAAGLKLRFKPPQVEEGISSDEADDIARAIAISLGEVPEDSTVGKTIEEQPAPKNDKLPIKKRKLSTNEVEKKLSKKRKLAKSPPRYDENQKQEEEGLLLPFSNSEEDDDFETLKFLMAYMLEGISILHGGTFRPNFETSVTDFINQMLPSDRKITSEKCRKKLMDLHKKYLRFVRLNGGEDLSEDEFDRGREYQLFQMCRIVWRDGQESGGSGADTNSNPKQNIEPGTNVEQGVNVEPGTNEAQGVNVDNAEQGAGGNLEDNEMGNLEGPGVNVDQGNVADPGADEIQANVADMQIDADQENVDNMEVDDGH